MSAGSEPSSRSHPRARLVAALLAFVPSALLAMASLWWTVSGARGGGLWPPVAQTLSEAAAAADAGEIVWQIQTGADPNAPTAVRPGLVTDSAATLTPLEAAVRAREANMVQLLIEHGAVPDPSTIAKLRCLNISQGNDERIGEILEGLAQVPLPACDTASPAR